MNRRPDALRTLALAGLLGLGLAGCQMPVRPSIAADEPAEPVQVAQPAATTAPATAPAAAPSAPDAAAVPGVPTPIVPAAAPPPLDNGAEVFARLGARLSAPACVQGAQNETWRRRYAGHPETFQRRLVDILPLMAYVLGEVEAADLPGEYALIPIVESWYRPEAIGPGGPAGMWQMIASTARNHGIRIQPGYDGRLSPVDSTRAALAYLGTLDGMFDDWRAVAMAYNAGEYRILRAFRANGDRRVSGEAHLPKGLSRITYDYVAKLRALSCLLSEPGKHGLALPLEHRFTPLQVVDLPPGVGSLEQAAVRLGTPASQLRRLNPAFRQGRVVANAPRRVLAPAGLLANLVAEAGTEAAAGDAGAGPAAAGAPVAEAPAVHTVRRGDTLSAIARRYGAALDVLLRANGLRIDAILHPGQVLRLGL